MKYIAFTVKGLEKIAVEELQTICADFDLIKVEDKSVIFETSTNPSYFKKLRSLDDIGLLVLEEKSFEYFGSKFDELNLEEIIGSISSFRNLQNTFSITLSIAGIKINQEELLDNLIRLIKQKIGFEYIENDHSNLDFRIFVNKNSANISMRLFQNSLLHREHKIESSMGALRPTVGGAMVFMATKGKSNLKIVDNFCGSGTILEEAFIKGYEVFGGDLEKQNIPRAIANLENLGFMNPENIKAQDATKTNWKSGFFDSAISNLPWDKQIPVDSITNLYVNTLKEYKRILKSNGSLFLILTKPELLIKHAKKIFPEHKVEQFRISYLGQQPSIILIKHVSND